MVRIRAWLLTVLSAASLAGTLATAFVPDWIERVFEASPDAGDGSAEVIVVLALVAATLASGIGAVQSWRAVSSR